MSWQRPNIGSRVNREVHARFWEQPEVQSLRLTRLSRLPPIATESVLVTNPVADSCRCPQMYNHVDQRPETRLRSEILAQLPKERSHAGGQGHQLLKGCEVTAPVHDCPLPNIV